MTVRMIHPKSKTNGELNSEGYLENFKYLIHIRKHCIYLLLIINLPIQNKYCYCVPTVINVCNIIFSRYNWTEPYCTSSISICLSFIYLHLSYAQFSVYGEKIILSRFKINEKEMKPKDSLIFYTLQKHKTCKKLVLKLLGNIKQKISISVIRSLKYLEKITRYFQNNLYCFMTFFFFHFR